MLHLGNSVLIGAFRAVWVPGQDLATPHLMRNSGSVFCHYTVRLCMCKHAYAGLRARCVSSRPVLVIRVMHASK